MRLAPVQFATQGHPASTRSEFIDFIFLGKIPDHRPDLYNEETVLGTTPSIFSPHKGLEHARPNARYILGRSEVDIAINGKLMKLNYQLLEVCKYLTSRSRIPLKFHFFPGERGNHFDGILQSIKSNLSNAEVYPLMKYEDLLEKISLCDFALSPMPFGNANGVVDCSLVGVPTLHCIGPEASSQTDAAIMRIIAAPGDLTCSNLDQYRETALRLIHDLDFRAKMRAAFIRDDVYNAIYQRDISQEFSMDIDVIWQAVEQHKSAYLDHTA
jgi:predicted O-linked N-acetylglucosamine transferase (SPINDLY family)